MKISFFKTSKPKSFSYRPLYYDERKEELNKIKQSMSSEAQTQGGERMRMLLQRSWHNRRDRQRSQRTSTLRLLIYLAALALAIYFMFFARIF